MGKIYYLGTRSLNEIKTMRACAGEKNDYDCLFKLMYYIGLKSCYQLLKLVLV